MAPEGVGGPPPSAGPVAPGPPQALRHPADVCSEALVPGTPQEGLGVRPVLPAGTPPHRQGAGTHLGDDLHSPRGYRCPDRPAGYPQPGSHRASWVPTCEAWPGATPNPKHPKERWAPLPGVALPTVPSSWGAPWRGRQGERWGLVVPGAPVGLAEGSVEGEQPGPAGSRKPGRKGRCCPGRKPRAPQTAGEGPHALTGSSPGSLGLSGRGPACEDKLTGPGQAHACPSTWPPRPTPAARCLRPPSVTLPSLCWRPGPPRSGTRNLQTLTHTHPQLPDQRGRETEHRTPRKSGDHPAPAPKALARESVPRG